MDVFWVLFIKILPLYALMGLGYIAGRYMKVQRKSIGTLLLYILLPAVYFASIATTPLNASTLSFPLLFFVLCSLIAALFLFIGGFIWKDPIKNICAQACGGGNYGYFAIPVAMAIFDKDTVGLIVLAGLGYVVYENTVGYFIIERGKKSIKSSLLALEKLPAIWAIILGLIFNVAGLKLDATTMGILENFKGAFTILGMMIIGLGLSTIQLKGFTLNYAYITLTFLSKFVVWPIIMAMIIFLDRTFFHFYSPTMHKVLTLMSVLPLAANTIVYAIALKIDPENVAIGVLLSTLFALIFIPIITVNFIL